MQYHIITHQLGYTPGFRRLDDVAPASLARAAPHVPLVLLGAGRQPGNAVGADMMRMLLCGATAVEYAAQRAAVHLGRWLIVRWILQRGYELGNRWQCAA